MVTNSDTSPVTLTVGCGNFGGVFAGTIAGSNDFTLKKTGAGQQTLCGTNIAVENVVINEGSLKLGQIPPDAVAFLPVQ